ncbi:copper resistance protein B [Hyphomonas sp.]|uniref:copper resistance protein B n=1 Tax=Hyphomonas sp. TaxID=87 RepID=UPI0035285A3F
MRRTLFSAFAALTIAASASAQTHDHPGASSEDKPWSQADAYFDPAEMDAARAHAQSHSGNTAFAMVRFDRLEAQSSDGETTGVWDADAWYGGDVNKIWLKTEGEYSFEDSDLEEAEVQLLWSRAISRYFDLQTGVRYDFEPKGQAHAVLGVQGLAPYWFEVDGAAFLSESGDLTASFEAEYELLLTNRLILQPRLEANFSAQDIPERDLGSGLTDIQAGLRLRYEIRREFAPYIGIKYQSAFGSTADRIKAAGGEADDTRFVTGIRTWY